MVPQSLVRFPVFPLCILLIVALSIEDRADERGCNVLQQGSDGLLVAHVCIAREQMNKLFQMKSPNDVSRFPIV